MVSLNLSTAILIGGKSSRMGQPKALLRLAPQAPTLLESAVNSVRRLSGETLLIGDPEWVLPDSLADLPVFVDGGHGAMDGVMRALETARCELCLVVGCDMPFLDTELIQEMVALANVSGQGVIAVDSTGRHPLHAVYRKSMLPIMAEFVARDIRSLVTISREIGMLEFDVDDPGHPEEYRWSVFNANTPAEFSLACRHYQGQD